MDKEEGWGKKEPRENKENLKKDYTSTEVRKNLYSNKLLLNSFPNPRKWTRTRKGLSGQGEFNYGPQLNWDPGKDSCHQLVSMKPTDLPSPSSSLSSGPQHGLHSLLILAHWSPAQDCYLSVRNHCSLTFLNH